MVGGVSAADDARDLSEGGVGGSQIVLADDRVEGALVGVVAQLRLWNIVGRAALPLSDGQNLISRSEDEFGVGIDEALNEPWTGNAVDLRPLAGYPLHKHHQLTTVIRTLPLASPSVKRVARLARIAKPQIDRVSNDMCITLVSC